MNNNSAQNNPIQSSNLPNQNYADDYTPPGSVVNTDLNKGELLEDQNIFVMLGVNDGTDELKENFLNELQDVIWDDFLENDVKLLITDAEKEKFDSLLKQKESLVENKDAESSFSSSSDNKSEEIQDALVAYLETLIPDLEDIMLEKALDLKEDLFLERIAGMKEFNQSNLHNLAKINDAEKMMKDRKWSSSADLLNTITD